MRALVLFFALLACACGTRTVGGEGSREPAPPPEPAKFDAGKGRVDDSLGTVTHLDVELSPVEDRKALPRTRVHLVITDETGGSRREEVGVFAGRCERVGDAVRTENMHPFFGLECRNEGAGVDLRFVLREYVVVVLRAHVEEEDGEEPYYDEHVRIDLPKGAKVVTD